VKRRVRKTTKRKNNLPLLLLFPKIKAVKRNNIETIVDKNIKF
jgi:vacuolar-type H+-ATPase subunit F/Vma7